MKLAFCLFRYYPFGGLERDFINITQECKKRGHLVDVYTMQWQGEKIDGIEVIILPMKGFTNHTRCRLFAAELQKYLSKQTYDLVIGFNRMPGLDIYFAADICYKKSVKEKHNFFYRYFPRYRLYSSFEKAVFKQEANTAILLLVERERQFYMQYYATPAHRFHLVPPGIDKNRIPYDQKEVIRSKLRQELKITEYQQIILMVGSDFKRKGVDRALSALAVLPMQIRENIKLIIIGKGNNKSLLQLAEKLHIDQQVLFLGTKENVGEFMLAADLLLHPARQETAGMVLLEALVAGLPVLVTENCGYAYHIQQANAGLIVPQPYNQKILNEYLFTMLNSQQKTHWCANARNYAEREDLYHLPQRAADLFEKIVVEKRGSLF